MEEMYVLHELQEDSSHESETSQDLTDDNHSYESQEEPAPVTEPPQEPREEHPPNHRLELVPIEEPGPDWEMELAQAYVRAQPLEGVFPPEEGLRMGTIFPNLSQPYDGRA